MADTDPKPSSPKAAKPSAPKPTAPKAEQNVGGAETRAVAAAKTGVKADTASVKSITNAFSALTTAVKLARAEFKGLMQDASKATKAMAGATGAVSGSYVPSGNSTSQGAANSGTSSGSKKSGSYIPSGNSTSQGAANNPASGTPTSTGGSGGGNKGVAPPLAAISPFAAIASLIGSVVGAGVGAMDKRIDTNMAYALPADRLSMVQQQMTGQTQQQVHQQSRSPLSNYKLGEGGINAALSNQVRYGINANSQAAGYEALRTVSGFSLSTQDLIGMQNQMMSAPVANRMFAMTGGTNFNKMGGGAADMFTTFQKLGKISGLDNEKVLKGAAQQGSAVRSNLSNMGLTGEAQDLLIQYAQENQTYKSKGGKGQYNPQDKASRKLMGVEDNYANQSESTKATQVRREERMYADQASNYAKLEQSNQSLINALSDLDHTMKEAYGLRTRTRPQQKALGGFLSSVGNVAMAAGGVMLATGVGAPLGGALMAGGAVASGAGAILSGDGITPASPATPPASPVAPNVPTSAASNDDAVTIPFGPKREQRSLTYVKNLPTFQMLKPIMQTRLLKLFRENPRVGIGEGFRSNEKQKQLFLGRYRRTDKKTKDTMSYDGSNWEKINPLLPDAAPPGKSMHELGLAADLEGDLNWLVANASRFGLKTFANENKEPWHVQPLEFPSDRFHYEKGVKDGTINSLSEAPSASTDPAITSAGSTATSPNGYASSGARPGHNSTLYDGLTGQQITDAMVMKRPGANSSRSPMGIGAKPPAGANTLSKVGAPSGSPLETAAGATLTPEQIAQVAYNAGFRGKDLTNMVAIGLRESHGHVNSVNLKNKDDSHGLWQINFKPHAQGPFMESLGYSRSSLYDPNNAAKAAFAIYKKNHNSLQAAWLTGKGHALTDPGVANEMPKAVAAVNALGLAPRGDPVPRSSGGGGGSTITPAGGGTVHFNSSPTITMPMNFTFQGVPGDLDIKKIAAQVRNAIKTELDIELTRAR